jgi:polyisoprenoid-binding protein YceI
VLRSSLVSVLLMLSGVAQAAPLLEDGAHCVAYKAEKVMLFVSKSEVIGRNCDISAQVLPEVGGLYHIEVIIPLHSFSSGDVERDRDVAKILKESERPEMTFRTKAMNAADWKKLFAKPAFEIEGELTIGAKAYPVKLQSHYISKDESAEIEGLAKVRFEDFGISPPKVVAGIVAKAKPEFELYFHLLSQRILGADSIRLGSVER